MPLGTAGGLALSFNVALEDGRQFSARHDAGIPAADIGTLARLTAG
ncbi:MAG TPA: hypothetical protein VGF07_04270 [Stellaceae bacterium]